MRKAVYFFVVLTILSLGVSKPVKAESDCEYWSKYNFNLSIKNRFSLYLEPQFKFLDDVGFYYYKLYVGPVVTLKKRWKLALLYAYKDKKKKSIWEREDLLYLDGVGKFNLRKIIIDNRVQGEYSFSKEEWATRLKVKLSKNKLLRLDAFQPFIEEEIFYNFNSNEFYENRAELTYGIVN